MVRGECKGVRGIFALCVAGTAHAQSGVRGERRNCKRIRFPPPKQNKPEDLSPGLLFDSNLILLLRFIPQLHDLKPIKSENIHIPVDQRRAADVVMVANLDVEHLV